MDVIIGIGIFTVVVLTIESISQIIRTRLNRGAKRVRKELKALSTGTYITGQINIKKAGRQLSDVPWFNKMLSSIHAPLIRKLDRLLQQADAQHPLGVYLLIGLLLAFSGFWIVRKISGVYQPALAAGAVLGIVPFLYISYKGKCRTHKFEEQLPDALDLIVRALRAGQAFSGGIQMVSEEFEDPIGSEFERTLAQINVGVGYEDALKNLTERIDCPDLKFFAISVIIQRQSGGNLAEILENISHLIRERFKLRGHIRALVAEGKISAVILMALPFLIVGVLSIINPKYVSVLVTDPTGKKLIAGCLGMMFIGVLAMKKIINIKV